MNLVRKESQEAKSVGLPQHLMLFPNTKFGFTLVFGHFLLWLKIVFSAPLIATIASSLTSVTIDSFIQTFDSFSQSFHSNPLTPPLMTIPSESTNTRQNSTDKVTNPLISIEDFLDLLDAHHPFAKLLGIQIMEIGAGTSLLALPPNPDFQRLGGIVAGPMLMGLADLAMYAAVVGATGNPEAVTSSLTMNFLRKSPPGVVLAHARVLKTGRLCAGDVTLTAEGSDIPLAHSVSTWSLPSSKK